MSVLSRRLALLALAAAPLLFPAPALAQGHHHGAHPPAAPIAIEAPWSRATPPGAKVAGGYMTIANRGAAADRLVAGSFDIAGTVEIHEMAMEQGVMKMRALDKGLEIAPGRKAELKPGGYHVMFIDLKRQLKEGETFKGELVFEKAGRLPVEFRVMGMGARAPSGHHH